MLPNAGPGLSEPSAATGETSARDARAIAAGLAAGELSALYLLHLEPRRLNFPTAEPLTQRSERNLRRAPRTKASAFPSKHKQRHYRSSNKPSPVWNWICWLIEQSS